jgi:hypothetical protein
VQFELPLNSSPVDGTESTGRRHNRPTPSFQPLAFSQRPGRSGRLTSVR